MIYRGQGSPVPWRRREGRGGGGGHVIYRGQGSPVPWRRREGRGGGGGHVIYRGQGSPVPWRRREGRGGGGRSRDLPRSGLTGTLETAGGGRWSHMTSPSPSPLPPSTVVRARRCPGDGGRRGGRSRDLPWSGLAGALETAGGERGRGRSRDLPRSGLAGALETAGGERGRGRSRDLPRSGLAGTLETAGGGRWSHVMYRGQGSPVPWRRREGGGHVIKPRSGLAGTLASWPRREGRRGVT